MCIMWRNFCLTFIQSRNNFPITLQTKITPSFLKYVINQRKMHIPPRNITSTLIIFLIIRIISIINTTYYKNNLIIYKKMLYMLAVIPITVSNNIEIFRTENQKCRKSTIIIYTYFNIISRYVFIFV